MGELLRRALPGAAAGVLAAGSVLVFDAVLHPAADPGIAPVPSGSSGGRQPQAAQADGCAGAEQIRGAAAQTPWGPVQVVAEVAGSGTVCSVAAVAYPAGDPRSQMINSRAIPQLDAAAERDGIAFDAVSGATYTSAAYRRSLQSALDSL